MVWIYSRSSYSILKKGYDRRMIIIMTYAFR